MNNEDKQNLAWSMITMMFAIGTCLLSLMMERNVLGYCILIGMCFVTSLVHFLSHLNRTDNTRFSFDMLGCVLWFVIGILNTSALTLLIQLESLQQ